MRGAEGLRPEPKKVTPAPERVKTEGTTNEQPPHRGVSFDTLADQAQREQQDGKNHNFFEPPAGSSGSDRPRAFGTASRFLRDVAARSAATAEKAIKSTFSRDETSHPEPEKGYSDLTMDELFDARREEINQGKPGEATKKYRNLVQDPGDVDHALRTDSSDGEQDPHVRKKDNPHSTIDHKPAIL